MADVPTPWLPLALVVAAPADGLRPVALREGERVPRKQFLADVAAWQSAFQRHGGQRFGLFFEDAYRFACALYGAWHAGKSIVVPGDQLPQTRASLRSQLDAWAAELDGSHPSDTAPARLQALDPDATGLTLFTSGSSGEPSAIDKRLRQLDAEVHTLQAAFGERVGDAEVAATVSHQHIYGLLFSVLWPLASGRPVVAQRLEYPEQIAALTGRPARVLISSPAHLRRLPESLDWSSARAGLRAVFSSGGPLPPEAAEAAQACLGCSPIEVFGSSETGGIAWRQRAAHGDRWQPLPGVDWRVVDGLLEVRSPHLGQQGWWATEDRAALIDGGLELRGRADRIVKIEEKRVSLTAIERGLAGCDEVSEARVLPLGAARLGAVVVPTDVGWELMRVQGKRALNERLRLALEAVVDRVAIPRRWRYVRALPVNSQGKTTEAALTSLFDPVMPLPEWIEREPGHARARLDVKAGLAVFDGHFPQSPVLPGVAQVDWAIAIARQQFDMPARCLRMEVLKFQRLVPPGTELELDLRWDPKRALLGFSYSSAAGQHASGRIVFADGHG